MSQAVALGAALASALALGACSDVASVRDVRVTIVDENGSPLPGAAFWADSRHDGRPIGFVIGIAGEAGEVPDSAREPLKITWRPGARMVLAAFASGRDPAILGVGEERTLSDGAVLVCPKAGTAGSPPPLDGVAFPLEDAPELAEEARRDPAWPALEAAFRNALEARRAAPGGISPGEMRKSEALGL